MSALRPIPIPGRGRITLALLALVPAVLAYPWRSPRDHWLPAIAAAVLIVLFGWWGGLHFTTILRRRAGIVARGGRFDGQSASPAEATALLRVGAPGRDDDVLPLPLIAGYLDRYGIRADRVRITSRDHPSDPSRRETWIALTLSAVDNLRALRARSARIPLHETAEVAARRLADQLREAGWEAGLIGPDDVPRLLPRNARETWRGVRCGDTDYVSAYRVRVDDALPETLDAIRRHPARETCAALEIAGDPGRPTIAAACAFLTGTPPAADAPPAGLTPQRGNHGPALAAMDLLSTGRLDGHTDVAAGMLTLLRWPTPEAGAHRAPVRT